ncbi:hypothetical protein J4457_05985 [Candidatus Woesearchaeota archaeon]|nr:hypothetical protein [Candidatus Woesearchaeota archaeon]
MAKGEILTVRGNIHRLRPTRLDIRGREGDHFTITIPSGVDVIPLRRIDKDTSRAFRVKRVGDQLVLIDVR